MQQLLISILEDLNNTSTDIIASAVISTDGLPMATMLPSHLNSDRVGAISATLLALGSRSVQELACGELEQVMIKGKSGYILLSQAGKDGRVGAGGKRNRQTWFNPIGCQTCGKAYCGSHITYKDCGLADKCNRLSIYIDTFGISVLLFAFTPR